MTHEKGHYGQIGRHESYKRYYAKNKKRITENAYDKCDCGNRKSKSSQRCWECYKRDLNNKSLIQPLTNSEVKE